MTSANHTNHPGRAFDRHTSPVGWGGSDAVDVQWILEGVTELLPVCEQIEDGAEIMWAEHAPRKLKNLRRWIRTRKELTRGS